MTKPVPYIKIRQANIKSLSHFDVDIAHRAVTLITGPSGSGKSSLAIDCLTRHSQNLLNELFGLSGCASEHQETATFNLEGATLPCFNLSQIFRVNLDKEYLFEIFGLSGHLQALLHSAELPCPSCHFTLPQRTSGTESLWELGLKRFSEQLVAVTLSLELSGRGTLHERFDRATTASQLGQFRKIFLAGQIYDLDDSESAQVEPGLNSVELVLDRFRLSPETKERFLSALALIENQSGSVKLQALTGALESFPLSLKQSLSCPACGYVFELLQGFPEWQRLQLLDLIKLHKQATGKLATELNALKFGNQKFMEFLVQPFKDLNCAASGLDSDPQLQTFLATLNSFGLDHYTLITEIEALSLSDLQHLTFCLIDLQNLTEALLILDAELLHRPAADKLLQKQLQQLAAGSNTIILLNQSLLPALETDAQIDLSGNSRATHSLTKSPEVLTAPSARLTYKNVAEAATSWRALHALGAASLQECAESSAFHLKRYSVINAYHLSQSSKTLAVYLDLLPDLAALLARSTSARMSGLKAEDFYQTGVKNRGLTQHASNTAYTWKGQTLEQLTSLTVQQALEHFRHLKGPGRILQALEQIGLSYLPLNRSFDDLSSGEKFKVELLHSTLQFKSGSHLILNLPEIFLSPTDLNKVENFLQAYCSQGNAVTVLSYTAASTRQ